MDHSEQMVQKAVALGQRNLEIIKLAQNFCKYFQPVKSRWGGVGLVEQMTGASC